MSGRAWALRAAAILFVLTPAALTAHAQPLYSEDFSGSHPGSGLPTGWSAGPSAHIPFFTTARDESVFGAAPPSLRVDLPLQVLNYWVATRSIPLAGATADYTVRLSLRVDQPDAAFVVEAAFYDTEGHWAGISRLLNLVGQRDDTLRAYTLPLHAPESAVGGSCRIMIGLPYAKLMRAGRFWLDDFKISAGREAGALDFYLSPSRAAAGGEIGLYASAGRGRAVVSVFREGDEQRLIDGPMVLESLAEQPVPAQASRDGCNWPLSARIRTGTDWPSGVYTVKLDDGERTVWSSFLIRGSGGEGRILIMLPTDTEEAYNDWGGWSFYTNPPTPVVSYARPRSLSLFGIYAGTVQLLRWLEREGIAYAVASDSDIHDDPDLLFAYPGVVIPGHSEYWTRGMRTAVEEYIAARGSVISLSGNTCWWQTRVEEDEAGRRLVCYKYDSWNDPFRSLEPSLVTTHWDEPPVSDPPTRFLGLSWREGGMVNWSTASNCPCAYDWLTGHGGYRVFGTAHWAFAGTGLADGDTLGRGAAIVGYEVDGARIEWSEGRPSILPGGGTPEEFAVLGMAPCWNQYRPDSSGVALMGIIDRGASFVWNSGTTGWCWGLAADPAVQRITMNLIDHLPNDPPSHPTRPRIRVFPNPARGSVTVDFASGTASSGADVISPAGRRVANLRVFALGGGRAHAIWSFHDEEGRDLPSGVYWIRARGVVDAAIVHIR
jgi:hypothetical protein